MELESRVGGQVLVEDVLTGLHVLEGGDDGVVVEEVVLVLVLGRDC